MSFSGTTAGATAECVETVSASAGISASAGVIFCVMTLIMLLSKKEDFVWEIKNEMEMCFGQQIWWSFKIMECGKDG